MSSTESQKKAEQFLRDQAKIIEKYGRSPKLKGEKYRAAVKETKRIFELISHESQNK